ncbi:DUF2182 domain-containing protein [Phenylobacterium sp.]|uniref:DUF2182 domain-containing protein n=1 Tax=Phenylobacterium sp. TaxID=1871053 RepID=UPI002FC83097
MPGAFERLLSRRRAITVVGLLALCALAWLYILTGAGLGMSAREMTTLSLFPHKTAAAQAMPGMDMSGMDMPGMVMDMGPAPATPPAWTPRTAALMVAMWWAMMIAMMSPSAAPTILLYAQVHRRAVAQSQIQDRPAPTGAFAAGYLLTWLGFSVAAAGLQWVFGRVGLISDMGSQSRWLSGGLLIAAGLYQLSPLKQTCLAHCRAPAAFLSTHWRPGATGALRLGLRHGAYCVGCCWMLMALLFVGGVMNLAWIAALAVLVLAEKLFPAGRWIGLVCGAVLVGWGVATLLV